MDARARRDYGAIAALTRPDAADLVAQMLLALDDFSDANRELCAYVRAHVADGAATLIDQSRRVADQEVFSAYVELLDEQIDGDRATVSFTVNDRLPAQRSQLVRLKGAWRYDPGPLGAPELPAAFHAMAKGLRAARSELERGRPPPDDLRRDPDLLVQLVLSRLAPGVERLPPPPAANLPHPRSHAASSTSAPAAP
jgi:hypothetical protein